MPFVRRIGNFFLLSGIILIVLFVYTDWVGSAYFGYALMAVPSLILGMFLRSTAEPPPPPPSNRFRMLKKEKKPPREHEEKE